MLTPPRSDPGPYLSKGRAFPGMSTPNVEIANTILSQLGGSGRLSAMTGAKDYTAHGDGLRFTIGRNPHAVSMVQVELAGDDTYTVSAWGRMSRKTYTRKAKSSANGVHVGELKGTIERATGLFLSL